MNDPIVTSAPKALKRFLKEATRFEKFKPNVAYLCRLHAVNQAMGMDPRPMDWLKLAMTKIEADKPAGIQDNRAEFLDELEEVAMNAFGHADDIDRAGNADKKTALTFNTAATLLQVLAAEQGDNFTEELQQKKGYALWKATDIIKAIKAGRKPTPGPKESEEEIEAANPFAPAMPNPSPAAPAPAMNNFQPVQPAPNPMPSPSPMPVNNFTPPNQPNMRGNNFEKKVHTCTKAEMTMKHAFSAMRFNDVDTAIAKLEETLAQLRPYQYS